MPVPSSRLPNGPLRTKLLVAIYCLCGGWTGLIGLVLWADLRANTREAEAFAQAEAVASLEKDILYRRWASERGGVYAPISPITRPNPHLADLPHRDLTTVEGTRLTLINPAYMTRMVHELGETSYGIKGHITSLTPLNPQNAPDAWETKALQAFERGIPEVNEITTYRGRPALRLIRPFVTEPSCLYCHAQQGYRVGDVRGGISTSVPLDPYYSKATAHNFNDTLCWLGVLCAGLGILGFGGRTLHRSLAAREDALAALRESERRTRQMIERLPLLAATRTAEGIVTNANPALLALVGRSLPETVGRSFSEIFVAHPNRPKEEADLRAILATRELHANTTGTVTDRHGREHTITWVHTLISDERGDPIGLSSFGNDITDTAAEDLQLRILSHAVTQSPVSILITDAEGAIEYVNPKFTEITGYLPAEVVGQNPRILASGDAPKEFYRELWETLRAGKKWRGVFHNRKKNSEHFWEDAQISPIRDATGAIVRFVAIKEDITERRRSRLVLEESEKRFRTLIENAPIAVVVHRERRCIYANLAALRIFGYQDNVDPTGIDIRAHIQAASLDTVFERERRTAAGEPNPPAELELRRCDGSLITCESIASGITFNDRPATLAMLVDVTERRQMLAAVEESEARYRALVEIAPVAIFAVANGRFGFANPAAAKLFGFTEPAELIGSNLWQQVHSRSLADATKMLGAAEAGAEASRFDLTLLRRDRSTPICEAIAVRVSIGRQSSVLVLATDVTENKKLEQSLRENEARMRETLESTNAGYFLLDHEHRLLHANSAFLEFFGTAQPAAAPGRSLTELLPASCRAAMADSLARLSCGEEFGGGQLVARHDNGASSFFSYTAHIVRDGERITGCEGFVLDTTEAHTSEERYQMLFDQMLDGFALHEIVCDAGGAPVDYRFLAVNPAFEKLIGQPSTSVVGRTVRQIMPGIEDKWIERYGRVVLEGAPLRIEDYSSELGRYFEISAFRTEPGRFAVLVSDITERRRLESQLRQAQKMEAVGQLAGGVAHDYNNILVAILMNLSILRSETALSPETLDSLNELEREAKRAATLTRQLLVFSRRQAVQATLLDFNEQLTAMLSLLRRLIGEHITIDTAMSPNLAPIVADPGMIDQVIMNLCVNARDAMPAGGRLTLRTAKVAFSTAPTAQHPESRVGDFLLFSVRDTGTGIDPDTRGHIFEPFFTTKEPGKGTGLGLATVLSIVKQHDGWIEFDSTLGGGSTFHIFLPFAPEGLSPVAATMSEPAAPANAETEAHTILLVEDDAMARQTIGLTLRRAHNDVLEASNVEDALALWKEHRARIAAVVTDVVMPGGSTGLDLAQTLRREDPSLGIIVISGYSDDAARRTPLVEGARYLAKPFDYDTLIRTIHTTLAQRAAGKPH